MNNYYEIDMCRVRKSRHLVFVLNLGFQTLIGVFPKSFSENYTRPLKVCYLERQYPLNAGDAVMDIGSNDATTLKLYNNPGNIWRARTAELPRKFFLASLRPDIVYVTNLIEGCMDDATTLIRRFERTGKTAVMPYDLVPFLNQKTYLPDQATRNYYFNIIDSLKKADLLMSISEFERQEGIVSLDLGPECVVNISTAIDTIFPPMMSSEEKQALHNRYGITCPFIMYAGGFDPRKNFSALFKAISLLPNHIRHQYQMLLVGEASKDVQELLKAEARKFGINDALVLDAFEMVVSVRDSDPSALLAKNLYQKLINTIAAIPQDHVRPTNQDLMATGQSIWNNERTVDQASCTKYSEFSR